MLYYGGLFSVCLGLMIVIWSKIPQVTPVDVREVWLTTDSSSVGPPGFKAWYCQTLPPHINYFPGPKWTSVGSIIFGSWYRRVKQLPGSKINLENALNSYESLVQYLCVGAERFEIMIQSFGRRFVWAGPSGSLTARLIRWTQWRQRGACRWTVAVLFCSNCDKKMSGYETQPQGYSSDKLLKHRLGTGGCSDSSFRARQTNPERKIKETKEQTMKGNKNTEQRIW